MGDTIVQTAVITGIGLVGPFGTTLDGLWEAQSNKETVFKKCSRYENGLPAVEAMPINIRQMLKSSQLSRAPLVSQYAVAATHLAVQQAEIQVDRNVKAADIGIVFSTSNGPGAATQKIYDDLIDFGPSGVKPRVFQESVFNAPASLVSIHFKFSGPIQVVPAGGCSGSTVLYQAQMMLAQPHVKTVIALCSEELCSAVQLGLRDLKWHAGFNNKGDLTPGAVMSEGSVALVLERKDDAIERGVKILAELAGVGIANDAAAAGQPDPTGRGLVQAIRMCLEDAMVCPTKVDMVLTGSAGTKVDDHLEDSALNKIFDDNIPPQGSAKSSIGVAMGTAAMFEIALAIASVQRKVAPKSVRSKEISSLINSVLCNSIGLNGQFGATLIRSVI